MEHLLLSLAFIPHANPRELSDYTPLLKLGWTLNYEMFFYAVMGSLFFVKSAQKEFEAAQFDYESTRARYAIPRVTIEAGGSVNWNTANNWYGNGVTGVAPGASDVATPCRNSGR